MAFANGVGRGLPHGDAVVIRDHLRTAYKDGSREVLIETLENMVGYAVSSTAPEKKGYCRVRTAIRIIAREDGVWWALDGDRQSYRVMKYADKMNESVRDQRRVHRRTKRDARRLASVKLDALKDDERSACMTRMAQIGTLAQMSSAKATKALEARHATKQLDMTRLLEAFKG